MRYLLILCVRFYQLAIGPFLPRVCIYEPTCSSYMIEALQRHGAIKGLLLGGWRILRCHPLARGGWDPVPPEWPRFGSVSCSATSKDESL